MASASAESVEGLIAIHQSAYVSTVSLFLGSMTTMGMPCSFACVSVRLKNGPK